MSKESFNLLKGSGYRILNKMGRQKFIPAFPPRTQKARARQNRLMLIKNLLLECLSDPKITERIRRCEDMVKLSLKIQDILSSPEYVKMNNPDKLRSTIAQLIVDPEHRQTVEGIIKKNRRRQWPKFEPICKIPRIKSPTVILKTIFKNYVDAWSHEKQRYLKNKAAYKVNLALKDLLSKDWLHEYCIFAGYVPVSKNRKLGPIGHLATTTCGCRKIDRFQYKKSFLEKLRKQAVNYRYHTMNRVLKRVNQRSVVRFHRRAFEGEYLVSGVKIEPGVRTRVFMASHNQPLESLHQSESEDEKSIASERQFLESQLKDMSSPQFSSTVSNIVAVKVFAMTPNLPLRLIPARVITQLELSTVLDHPNIVRFIETFATKRDIFVIMRYEVNLSLHHIMRRNGRLMQKTAKVWLFQIALALQYLHCAGVVHRNIKCSNILISEDYDAILTGFGSAKVKWMDLLHIQMAESKNYHVGYAPYRAPEVLQKKPYSMAPIDVWGLGVVLFVMLNNSFPYCYHNRKLMLRQQKLKKWNKAWNRDFTTSHSCLHLLKNMLEPEPSKRLRITDVVSHSWFKKMPVPKAHTKALRRAPFLFLRSDSEPDNVRPGPVHHPTHRPDKDTLDEINAILGTIMNRAEPRIFPPIEDIPGYQECYQKKLNKDNLLSRIDASLRRPLRKFRRERSFLEYEPFISEKEEQEIYEKTVTNIEELRERVDQVRKIVEPPQKEDRMKKTLAEVVEKVKEKAENISIQQEQLMKKLAIFMPKMSAPAEEPRSILQIKSLSTRERVLNDLRTSSFSKMSVSTTMEMRSARSGLGIKQSKDYSNPHFSTIASRQGLSALPKLGFVKHHANPSFNESTVKRFS